MNALDRIGLGMPEHNAPTDVDALSEPGKVFFDFLHDAQKATGNDPRALTRTKLLWLFLNDLQQTKNPEDAFMEEDHGYIQWFFPMTTEGVNPEAPVLRATDHSIMAGDVDVRARVYEHFELFVSFMGLSYDPASGTFAKTHAGRWKSWIEHSHNNLRISRILTSLHSFGLRQVAADFLQFLQTESRRRQPEMIDHKTFVPFSNITRDSYKQFWVNCVPDA